MQYGAIQEWRHQKITHFWTSSPLVTLCHKSSQPLVADH